MTSPSGPPPGAGGYPGQAPGYTAGSQGAPSSAPSGGALSNGSLQQEVHTLERAIFEVKRIIVGQDLLVDAFSGNIRGAGPGSVDAHRARAGELRRVG